MDKEFPQWDSFKLSSLHNTQRGDNDLSLAEAILKTIAYADIYDYPLRPEEIHRYMVGKKASLQEVLSALQNGSFTSQFLGSVKNHFMIQGRESIFETRKKRTKIAKLMLPRAIHYGQTIASLPYTRMVALTGALAVANADHNADIDYFLVTQSGRVWLCRAFVILFVRYISITKGDIICPNYVISEKTLSFSHQTLYTAHEITQMLPISGSKVYQDLRRRNSWTYRFLPNAVGPPSLEGINLTSVPSHALRQIVERLLGNGLGHRLEAWEMNRKIRKFAPPGDESKEAAFCADWCKGHFDNHGEHALSAYHQRVRKLGFNSISLSGDHDE